MILSLLAWLAICFVAATVGALASIQAENFYSELVRPDWAPPAWLFGPVWTVLYALMAVSAWLVWLKRDVRAADTAIVVFLVQLACNTLWSWLFFYWYQGALAFLDIVVLWILIVITTWMFFRVRPLAGALMLPYLFWVSFASALNFAIWQSNPSIL
jgi:benzodiazapine receptor